MPPVYDTYASVRRLVESGMPEQQAAAFVNEQVQLIADTLATKEDVRAEIKALDPRFAAIQHRLSNVDVAVSKLQTQLEATEARLTAKLGGLMIALAAALAAVIKVF